MSKQHRCEDTAILLRVNFCEWFVHWHVVAPQRALILGTRQGAKGMGRTGWTCKLNLQSTHLSKEFLTFCQQILLNFFFHHKACFWKVGFLLARSQRKDVPQNAARSEKLDCLNWRRVRIRLTKPLTGTLALGVGHGYEVFEAQSRFFCAYMYQITEVLKLHSKGNEGVRGSWVSVCVTWIDRWFPFFRWFPQSDRSVGGHFRIDAEIFFHGVCWYVR